MRGNRGIGEHEREHRRQVRRDHAGPLGEAVDGDCRPAKARARGCEFCERVGGHDRLGSLGVGVGRRGGDEVRHDAAEGLRRQRLADHAGRGEKDFRYLAADRRRRESGGQRAGLPPAFAGKGVGIAGIDHERAGAAAAALDPGAAPFDWRRRAF
jgi:hypothetical protein